MSNPNDNTAASSAESAFIGGGEMGKVVRAKDWSRTPLGPIESWPPGLRTAVSIVLNSNFPIALAWGPQHTQIYNDGYWPICAAKHPGSMGQDFSECWASAFPVIGDAFRSALAGTPAFLEDQRMFLDRLGYLEETFFTFSFSPIRDERGAVAGLFHPVTETTGKMLSERRTRTLRDLTAVGLEVKTFDEALLRSAQTLAAAALDVPFALFYRLDEDGRTARLIAQCGLAAGGAASPAVVDLTRDDAGWPLAQVGASGAAAGADDVRARFPGLVCGEYPEPIAAARVLPIAPPGHERAIGLTVIGVSPRLPMNEAYATFHELLGSTVSHVVASALAAEAERKQVEALAEIDRAKTAFFANISHEFRTPLTLMLGPLEDELAERTSPLPAPRRERLATAHRNSQRLLKLVNSLLDFSRIEAGRAHANYQPTDLAALTAELASTFRSAIEKAGLTLTVDCPPLPAPVFVDREMWEKVVLNLLSNAFKHTFTGGIRVALRGCGDHVELNVADTGTGIPTAELPHVFDRFHRVKGARSRTHEGTGIGLALVQELTRLHGGAVRVVSEEGKGSTFTATLKTGRAHLPEEHIAASSAPPAPATRATAYIEEALQWIPGAPGAPAVAPTAGRPRVVWADDNADMREYVSRLLGGFYDVTAVSNGAEAVALARATPPDLVLTDIMMPGLDGFGVLRELRADARTRHVPVILLSARAGEEEAVGGLELGADDYLAKPFSARELLARVRTHIELARVRREWAVEHARATELERGEMESRRLLATAKESRRALLGILEDQQRAEAALRTSEARFRRVVESDLIGMIFWNAAGEITEANDAFLRTVGYSRDDLRAGRVDWRAMTPPEYQPLDETALRAVATTGVCAPYEKAYLRKDGSRVPILIGAAALPGEPGQGVAFVLDITARKQAEEELREREERLRLLAEQVPVGIFQTDAGGENVFANARWCELTGLTPEQARGKGWVKALHPDDRAAVADAWAEATLSGEMFRMDHRLRTPEGVTRWVSAAALTQRDAAGNVTGYLGTVFDITERKQAEATLRKSEERFAKAFHASPVGICITSVAEGRFVDANEAFLQSVGFSREEVIGRTALEMGIYLAPGDRALLVDRLLAEGRVQNQPMRFRCKSGEVRDSLRSLELVELEGQPFILTHFFDITERTRAEAAQHESEARLRLSVAASNIGLWDWNLLTNEVYFSKEWKGQIGYAEDEISNRFTEWESRVHPDDLARTLAQVHHFISDPEASYSVEFRLRHKDGSYRWIYTQAQLMRDPAGKPVRMLGCHIDITERKRGEANLRLQSAALDAAANSIVITDRSGTIQWVNPAFTRASGHSFAAAVGQSPRLLKSGKHDAAFYQNLWDTILRGEVWHGEIMNCRKDKSLFTEEMTITPLKDERGEITHFVAIKQDITEKKLLEAKFLRAQRLEGLGALAGGVAHDLNNVLAPILMASELLKFQSSDPRTREMLDMIESNSQRGAGMIRQILAFARGTAGERIVLQPWHLLKDISKMMKDTFPPGIQCELRVDTELRTVLGNPTELYQVLLNLCVNARDAMPGGGTITLRADNVMLDETYARLSHAARPGNYVVLAVADTGSGIPVEIQEKIFEPFFTTKEPGKGTGLGLATVKDIVTSHGGFIHLYSEAGAGTQFKIYLPALAGEEAAGDATLLTLPAGHGELVLVVDDEAAVREIVKATLEGYGYHVVTASDGTEAVARFVEHLKDVQILFTDIQMPHMDGVATIRALRNIQPGLRVIAASGLTAHQQAIQGLGLTVQGFVAKPFTAASLLLALDAALHPPVKK